MADILCPMCGKQNPAEAETCWSCQARLKPLIAPQPPEENVPDWLSGLRGAETPEPETPGEGEPPADVPDWLARIRGREDEQAAEPAGDDLPEWMKDLRQEGSEPEAQPTSDGDLPEWMKDVSTTGETSAPGAEAGSGEDALQGDWLNSLRGPDAPQAAPSSDDNDWLENLSSWQGAEATAGSPEESTPQTPAESSAPGSESWMAGLTDWSSGEQTSSAQSADEQDWLAGFAGQPEQPAPEETTPAGPWNANLTGEETQPAEDTPFSWETPPEAEYHPGTALTGQLPDWLASEPPPEQLPAEQPPQGASPFTGDGEWNEGDEMPEQAESGAGFNPFTVPPFAAETQPPALPGDETPEWLKNFTADLPGAEEIPAETGATPEGVLPAAEQSSPLPFEHVDLPDWLNQDMPAESQPTPPALEGVEDLAMAQLPGWLAAMRPVETAVPQNQPPAESDDRVETSGPLAGLVGALPGERLVTHVTKPAAYSARLQVNDRQQQQATLIESLLGEEARPQPARPERSHVPERIARLVIALVLLIVLLLPLVSNLRVMPLPSLFQPDTVAFHRIVESLPANTPVLVAVDYEPGLSGEMQLAAAPVVNQLQARAARLGMVSTNPSGPVLAENLLRATGTNAGVPYTNLGFLPGGTAGLQEFASRPRVAMQYGLNGATAWDTPALAGVSSLSNFGALIVITENAETARAWIEQVQPVLGSTPLLMVVSAQAAPMVQPYVDSGQVQGMLAGMAGGTMYAQISGQSGAWLNYWDAYQFGIFVAIGAILLGGVVQIFSTLLRRPAGRKKA